MTERLTAHLSGTRGAATGPFNAARRGGTVIITLERKRWLISEFTQLLLSRSKRPMSEDSWTVAIKRTHVSPTTWLSNNYTLKSIRHHYQSIRLQPRFSSVLCVQPRFTVLFSVSSPGSVLFSVSSPGSVLFCVSSPGSVLFCVSSPGSLFCSACPAQVQFCSVCPARV